MRLGVHGGVRWAEAGVRAQDTRFWWQLCWTRPALWASFSRGSGKEPRDPAGRPDPGSGVGSSRAGHL